MEKQFEKLSREDKQVMTDAVRCLKSDFVALYVEAGFAREDVGLAWHQIRVSSKGREMMEEAYRGKRHMQALTFISDPKEELLGRKVENKKQNKMTKKKKEVAPAVTEAPVAAQAEKAEKAPKVEKVKTEKAPKVEKKTAVAEDSDRGKKTAIAKELIGKGETNAAIIAEKSGAALAYVRTLLYNYRKANKKK